VLDNSARIICLTRKEGRVKWIHQLPQFEKPDDKSDPIVWAGPVLVSDKLIVTSSNGYAESVSPYDGKLLGRVEIPDGTILAPIVANGIMYIYTSGAELVALR
jgi:outer membrane protein assembly factor BamB